MTFAERMGIVWLIISAAQSTWDLMLRIAEMKRNRPVDAIL